MTWPKPNSGPMAVPFEVALHGVGTFGKEWKPRALWAGVHPAEPVIHLNQKIDSALIRAGVRPEKRKYIPHITLARFKGQTGRLERFLQEHGDLASDPWPVTRITSIRSA